MVAVLLMSITVVGNFLVIWSYRINRRLRDINNMFLVSLACSDLVIGAVSMNLYPITMVTDGKWLGQALCTTWLCIDYTLSMASVANLLLICCDRYLSVTQPFTYRPRRTRSRAQIMIVSAWIISFLLFTPLIIFWPRTNDDKTQNDGDCVLPFVNNKIITIVTATFAFFLPIIVMFVLYGIIFKETRKCAKYLNPSRQRSDASRHASLISPSISRRIGTRRGTAISNHRTNSAISTQPSISSSERKAARTLSAILLAFFITWLPYNVCVVVRALYTGTSYVIPNSVWNAAYYLCYINSTINPFCFALCNKTFRKTFIKILTCKTRSWKLDGVSAYYESSTSSNQHPTQHRNNLLQLSPNNKVKEKTCSDLDMCKNNKVIL